MVSRYQVNTILGDILVMPVAANGIYFEQGGGDGPLAVFLHGLSGTGAIWRGVTETLAKQWSGRWIAPDFRGHGRSPHASRYGMALHAADIATFCESDSDVYLVGHSMGGQCAMVLASGWFGFVPKACITIGTAVDWNTEAKARIDKLVDMPARWFDSREEALQRFVLVNGVKGMIDADSDIAASGIIEQNGKWRLAADNRAAMVATISTRKVFAAAVTSVVLLRGEHDEMVSASELQSLDENAITVAGCGHNVHVEQPDRVCDALMRVVTGEKQESGNGLSSER